MQTIDNEVAGQAGLRLSRETSPLKPKSGLTGPPGTHPLSEQGISATGSGSIGRLCECYLRYLADAAKVAGSSSTSNQYEACGGGGNGVSFLRKDW